MVSFDLSTTSNWKQHSNLPWFSSKWREIFLSKLPLQYNSKLTCSLSLLRAVHAVMAVPFLVSMSARSVRRRAVSSEIRTSITKTITAYTRWTCQWKNRTQYNWLPLTRSLMLTKKFKRECFFLFSNDPFGHIDWKDGVEWRKFIKSPASGSPDLIYNNWKLIKLPIKITIISWKKRLIQMNN